MRCISKTVLLINLLFISTYLSAQKQKLLVAKEPSWITVTAISYTNQALDHEAEDGYLDLAFEKQVSLSNQSVYYKKAFKTLTDAGVQNISELSINFDPLYEQLIFHSIRIIRSNETINRLNLSQFKVIQQEKDLSKHLYDGTLSAVLFLEDVRKGDVVEYSYTLKGANPIFKGKYSDFYQTNFSVPVAQL